MSTRWRVGPAHDSSSLDEFGFWVRTLECLSEHRSRVPQPIPSPRLTATAGSPAGLSSIRPRVDLEIHRALRGEEPVSESIVGLEPVKPPEALTGDQELLIPVLREDPVAQIYLRCPPKDLADNIRPDQPQRFTALIKDVGL